MVLRHLAAQALILVVGASAASAGVLIVGAYTGTKTPKGRTVEFRIQDGRAKITGEPGQVIFYDHAKRTAYIVDTVKKTSFEMNEARAKQVGAQLAEAQKMMEAKIKELPPDQRAMVEEMMRKQGGMPPAGGAPQTPLTYKKAGTAKVGEWPCDRYTASADGRQVEVCAAEAAVVGIAPDDMAVFEGFLDLSEKMAGEVAKAGGIGAGPDRGFPGLPLERAESRDGAVTDRFTIEKIEAETIAASELRVPPGMKAVEPPGPPPR
jgi:hypothetical protein